MKLKRIGRVAVIATAASFAIATMSGAFALPPIQDEFNQCLDNATGGDIESIDVAKRISCCKQAGGAWVEIYDPDGNVIDGFCDGAEEVYEPEEAQALGTVNPAALGQISGDLVIVASDPTPAPAAVSDPSRVPAEVSDTPEDSASVEPAASDPTPAPKQIKRKHHRKHNRRHR
jgi:hypothetical protein